MSFLLGLMACAALAPIVSLPAATAETGTKALILNSSVSGGASSSEAVAAGAAGFTVTLVGDSAWNSMTAAQFADYQLVIVGDPTCGVLPQPVGTNKVNLADAVMARAGGNTKVGNRIVIGTDPRFHLTNGTTGNGGRKLIETGIAFAGAQEGATGLYLTTGCWDEDYDGNGRPDGVELLGLLTSATDNWTVDFSAPCGGSASLISNAAQFSTLTSAHLQGWFCSVHMTYPTFPTDWSPLAIATDTVANPVTGTDVDTGTAVSGQAHILIAGSGISVSAPNLALTPATATNPVGTTHTVTATVTNSDGTPRSGVLVDFAVTDANAGASGTCVPADCRSDATGDVTFTYAGASAGVDTINAAITVDGSRQTATATKTWVAAEICGNGADDDGDGLIDEGCNQPPVCSAAAASPSLIWPPNHKMVPVAITGLTDPDGDALTVTINSIRQDEPTNTVGDGNTGVDGSGVGTSTAMVRAERSGTPKVPGDGRVYHIGFTASDGKGGTCTGVVRVGVPHDQGGRSVPVDGGPLYDSTLP